MNTSHRVDAIIANGAADTTPVEDGTDREPEQVDVTPDLSTAAGIVATARAGESTVIANTTRRESRDLFDQAAHEAHDAEHISRANGREEIRYPNGATITIATPS